MLSVSRLCRVGWQDEWWIGTDLERDDIGLIEVLSQSLPRGAEENYEKLSQNKITNATQAPPEYRSRTLPLHQTARKFL
jgi:hypothetical protein